MSTATEPILLDVAGVAAALGLSVRTIWRLTSTGQLPPPLRIGRSVRWSRESLLEWVAAWEGTTIDTGRGGHE